ASVAIINEFFDLFNEGAKASWFLRPEVIQRRYYFERYFPGYEEQEKEDLEYIRQHGFPVERKGISVAVSYSSSDHANYIGVEFSPKGYMQRPYRLKNYNSKKKRRTGLGSLYMDPCYSFWTVGFNQSTTRSEYQCWFSPFQYTSPIFMFNFTKIGI